MRSIFKKKNVKNKPYINIPDTYNTLVLGCGGSGLQKCYVFPVLETIDTSFIAINDNDPEIENYIPTLQSRGFTVKNLLLERSSSSQKLTKYDPLKYCKNINDILTICNILISGLHAPGNGIWNTDETNILYISMIYAWIKEKTFADALDLIKSSESLSTETIILNFNTYVKMIKTSEPAVPNSYLLLSKNKDDAEKAFTAINKSLQPFMDREVKNSLSADEFNLESVDDKKTAIFVSPAMSGSDLNAIITIFTYQLLEIEINNSYAANEIRFRWLIHDITDFGNIINLSNAMNLAKQVKFDIIIHGLTDFTKVYGPNHNIIQNLCDTIICLGTANLLDSNFIKTLSGIDPDQISADKCIVIPNYTSAYLANKITGL